MIFFSSQYRHRLFGNNGYNIPKPKFLYYVNFISSNLPGDLSQQLSFFVKRADRIQLSYEVKEKNQYNKKRLVQTKINYNPISFSFHDTTDSSALRLIDSYNRFYYNDFDQKNITSWIYDISGAQFEPTGKWGLKGDQTPNSQHFFERIEMYEIFDQVFTKVSFINPIFTSVDFQQVDQEMSTGNEINVTMNYEGIVIENISEPITERVANLVGLPLVSNIGENILNSFNNATSGIFSDIIGAGASNNLFNSNIINQTINQAIGANTNNFTGTNPSVESLVFGSRLNSIVGGRTSFDNFNTISNTFASVSQRSRAGTAAREISTGANAAAQLNSSLIKI